MRLNIFNSLMGFCVATAAVSCSDALVDNVDMRPVGSEVSDMISFVVAENNNATRGGSFGNRPCGGAFHYSTDGADSLYLNVEVSDFYDDPMTRSSLATSANFFYEGNKFAVYGDMTKSGAENRIGLFNNEKVTCQGNDKTADWTYNNVRYWFPDNTYSFVALYPASVPATSSATSTSSPATNLNYTGNSLSFTYTTPKNYTEIKDFMTATEIRNVTEFKNDPVRFDFHHILSRINIRMKVDANVPGNIVVKKLALSNLPTSANYTITPQAPQAGENSISPYFNETWSDYGYISDATQNPYDFVKNDITIEKGTTYEFFPDKKEGESDGNILLVIPQDIPDNAELTITYNTEGAKTDDKTVPINLKELAANHDGEWKIGKSYTYNFSLKPEFGIEIEGLPEEPIDAHYVIVKNVRVKTPVDNPNMAWDLTMSAKNARTGEVYNKEKVTIVKGTNQTYAEYIKHYNDGYWLDKVANNGVVSEVSARGEINESGTGNEDNLYIFVPENITDDDRIIEIRDSKTDELLGSFTQRHPAWSSSDPNFGWEQSDEGISAQWGFYSKEKIVYVYNNTHSTIFGATTLNRIENMIKDLISQYEAETYVQYSRYNASGGARFWVSIDYSNFANLDISKLPENDGLNSTKYLNGFAGSAYTRSFENALTDLNRITDAKEKAFRPRSGDDPNAVPQKVEDQDITNPMLPFILKKNKYNLNKFKTQIDGKDVSASAPILDKIVWFLPSKNEFGKTPSNVDTPVEPADCWSSTALSDSEHSYSGSSKSHIRKDSMKIRVCRIKD